MNDDSMLTRTRDIWADIRRERRRQDSKWGGPDHDDRHSPGDWIRFIVKHLGRCAADTIDGLSFRQHMVRIAALAVAAIEACDRQEAERLSVGTTEEDDG